MSKITLEPNSSGAGTFSIQSPDSNSNRVLTLPDNDGTVLSDASTLARSNIPSDVLYTDSNIDSSNLTGTIINSDNGNTIVNGMIIRTAFLDAPSSGTYDLFSLSRSNGAMAGYITITISHSSFSVAYSYAFARQYGDPPVINELADTGGYNGDDASITSSNTGGGGLTFGVNVSRSCELSSTIMVSQEQDALTLNDLT